MSIHESFEMQAEAGRILGSPFLEQLMHLCAERLTAETAVARRMISWPGDTSYRGDSVPLRFAGALHRLVLTGICPELGSVWPPAKVDDDRLWRAVETAMHVQGSQIDDWLDNAPQTNEIRRSVALIPAFHMIAQETGLPLTLSELGCSAGLNLLADQYKLDLGKISFGPDDATVNLTPEWKGPLPNPADLFVADRAGVDMSPFDLTDEADRLRLLSYLWPDQPERMTNTAKAIEIFRQIQPNIEKADAIAWLEQRLAQPMPGKAHVVFHTVAWQYFPHERQKHGEELLKMAGARATADAPLARVSMEGENGAKAATLRLTTWPGGLSRVLGQVDFHGRWVEWSYAG